MERSQSALAREALATILVLGLVGAGSATGATPTARREPKAHSGGDGRRAALDPTTRDALRRGVEYLLRTQDPGGWWQGRVGRKVHTRYVGREAPHVGITALAGSSLIEWRQVRKSQHPAACDEAIAGALRFVLAQVGDDGFISAHGSRMYSHGFAVEFLALARQAGLDSGAPDLEAKLRRAVGLLVLTQNSEGGWRYLPGATDTDISITACQLEALQAAGSAGIDTPGDTLAKGLSYIRGAFVQLPSAGGAFPYQRPSPMYPASRRTFPLTAGALAALAAAGEEDSPEYRAGLVHLFDTRPPPGQASSRFDYYYGHHHAMRAVRWAERPFFESWCRSVRSELLTLQAGDGHWTDLVGPVYATAMAVRILLRQEAPPGRPGERAR